MKLKTIIAAALLGSTSIASAQIEVSFSHFFGDCTAEWGENLDLDRTTGKGECAVFQTMINKYNAENKKNYKAILKSIPGVTYYDALKASYAARDVPDIALMHTDATPGFARRNLLEELTPVLVKAGIDVNDYSPQAREAIQISGKYLAIPFDQHGLLWHMNKDLFIDAGLVDENGEPLIPSSPEEWLEQAKIMKQKTGATYFGLDMNTINAPQATWLWYSLVNQMGASFLSEDGTEPQFNTPEGREALNLIKQLVDTGAVQPNRGGWQEDFINGKIAVYINGNWILDAMLRMADSGEYTLKNYGVTNLPVIYNQPATYVRNHSWVMPTNPQRKPEVVDAAADFLGYLNDYNINWANTGHLPVRKSALQSEEFAKMRKRENYRALTDQAVILPPVINNEALQAGLSEEIFTVWQTGKPVEEALATAETRVARNMNR